ncbi:Peptidase S28 [Pleurostoma richardsiae]|uniref:Peptidase S28 n=1 Tax=Pleurostoma richardsiae TaxID=41990 RepID=A0AA38VLW5_9PEZI|nr:Peptidase S28 [Pleurostoma richardsiae]
MPVDHFDSSDTRVYNNRYWVNDTYYKPGGPVILYDFGEAGVDLETLAEFLAEFGGTISAPIELARALNGVVVGWEHRYYGYSHPFVLVNDTGSSLEEGTPEGGTADYEYLTVEQALEDVVFFAQNHFNKTQLNVNNTVLSGVNATQHLDPYHTPWIWVGGSYPGMRGAWLRLRNPEVIYATWASSAPVQIGPDGTAYYNSIYRALPKNCTTDIQAVAQHIDDVLSSTNDSAILDLKTAVYIANMGLYEGDSIADYAAELTEDMVARDTFDQVFNFAQSYGISSSVQIFCDYMETFDAEGYLSNSSLADSSTVVRSSVFLSNEGGAEPSDGGIVAANGDAGLEVGLAAYLYGYKRSYDDLVDSFDNVTVYSTSLTPYEDLHSWEWQVLSEIGLVQGINVSSPLHLGSKFMNVSAVRESIIEYFPVFGFDFPDEPNTTFPRSLGGWDMRPSNVMFTNGEFDPWRAFGVMSLDYDLGAPKRAVVQDVPKCGEPPSGTDVFGLLFGGAAHAEDIASIPGYPSGSIDIDNPPVRQGVELFLKAYNEWLPCFNASRTAANSGSSGSTGSGSGSGGSGGDGSSGGDDQNSAGRGAVPSVTWLATGAMLYIMFSLS